MYTDSFLLELPLCGIYGGRPPYRFPVVLSSLTLFVHMCVPLAEEHKRIADLYLESFSCILFTSYQWWRAFDSIASNLIAHGGERVQHL